MRSNKLLMTRMTKQTTANNKQTELEKQELERRKLEEKYKELEQSNKNLDTLWKNRTNDPYKVILKNEDFHKHIINQSDLIVYKVSETDKLGLDEQYDNKVNDFNKHNKELKNIFTDDKKQEYYNKFVYNNKYSQLISGTEKTKITDFSEMKKNIQNENKNDKTNNTNVILNELNKIDI